MIVQTQKFTRAIRSAPLLFVCSLTGSVVIYAASAPRSTAPGKATPQWVPLKQPTPKSQSKPLSEALKATPSKAHPIKSQPSKTLGQSASFAKTSGSNQKAAHPIKQAHPTAVRKPVAPSSIKKIKAIGPPTFEKDVAPLIAKYCADCHSDPDASAGLALDVYKNVESVLKHKDEWESVARNVDSQHMPPAGKPAPTRAERNRLVEWIESTISKAQCDISDPGQVTLRRLNREEYNNTTRDLVGVDFRPGDDFPSDDVGYGFDNIGDVLSISPLLMEKYLNAAEKIAEQAIVAPEAGVKPVRIEGEKFRRKEDDGSTGLGDPSGLALFTNTQVDTEYTFPQDGEYTLRVQAHGQQFGPDPTRMALRFDGKELRVFDVKATDEAPQFYEQKITTRAGKHTIALAYTNNYNTNNAPDPKDRGDRNLIVHVLEIKGPLGKQPTLPMSHRRIIFTEPTEATRTKVAREILQEFARRAYRRPVTEDEISRLVRYVDMAIKNGESFERGIQVAMQAVLVSPHFLFRIEADPDPKNPKANRLLNDYELATRLSYFLWSSMPDDQLLFCAQQGKLHEPKVLEQQVRRMLNSPKSQALADNFAMQWLTLRNLSNIVPDPTMFPKFTDQLRAAMLTETQMFFQGVAQEDRSVLDFLDCNYTYLNETLANHYGIEDVKGNYFRKVMLTGEYAEQRGGLLTQGSILTVTSNPTRTSPVKRGKWVLEEIFNTPPPPPPPDVPSLDEEKKALSAATLRKRLEQHRADPGCASCHARMDPIGFGLENFDATGAWRTMEGGAPIDSSGTLSNGKRFKGPAQLKVLMKAQKTQFVHGLAEKMLTYAMGRGVERQDRCFVDKIVDTVGKSNYKFSSLVLAVVQSDPFQKRKGDGGQSQK